MCSECTPRPEDFDACTRSLLNTLQFAGDAVDFRRFCLDQTDVAEFHQGSSKGLLHDLIHFLTLSVASASKNKRPLATPGLCSQTEESEFPAMVWVSGPGVVQYEISRKFRFRIVSAKIDILYQDRFTEHISQYH